MGRNIELDPKNARWYVYQGSLYNLVREFDASYSAKAEEVLEQALLLSPRRPQIYFDLAQAKFDQGKIDEAFEILERATRLEPRYQVGYRHKAAFAILAGRDGVARAEIERLRQNFAERGASPDEYWDILADAYFRAKKLREAAELYQETVDFFEKKRASGEAIDRKALAGRYARMAALWAMAGEKNRAYEAALKVVEYDPARRGEAEAFLKTIQRKLP